LENSSEVGKEKSRPYTGAMSVCSYYGFIPDTCSPDDEELDAYVLGVGEPLKTFTGKCIAVIPEGIKNMTDEEIRAATNFQEQFFKSEIIRRV